MGPDPFESRQQHGPDRLQEMNVSLWGKAVSQFLIEHKMHRQKNVVLIATGDIILSSTTATDLFFNPNCEEVRLLPAYVTATYDDFICPVPNPARPAFVLDVADHTGKIKFTLQTRELQQLTSYSREELLHGGTVVREIPAFPQALQKLKNA
ncbi:hypothetical protein AgCh_019789 [Apium graveolens]